MYVVFVLLAVAVVAAAAVVAAGRGGELGQPVVDRPGPQLPDGVVEPADVHDLRLAVALRGYRMDQVDAVLERLAAELAERDDRIARLSRDADGPTEEASA